MVQARTDRLPKRLRGKTRCGAGDILAVPAPAQRRRAHLGRVYDLPFYDEEARVVGIAAILRDVTKRFEEMKGLRKELAARQNVWSSTPLARPQQSRMRTPPRRFPAPWTVVETDGGYRVDDAKG
jgi:hypothetical protein